MALINLFMLISKSMKRFLLKIVLLFCIVAIFDIAFGRAMSYIVNHIEVGGQGRDNYICNESKDDIMIFGSSRAVHHYNAQMIEDSLNLSCYNCGDDGNGIILSYARLMMIEERKTPSIIIVDITPGFDYLYEDDNHKYLGWLKARYERKGVKDIFETIDPYEKYKMVSQMYRYNSKFLQNIFVYLTSMSSDTGIKGFRPIAADTESFKTRTQFNKGYKIDSLKISYINKLIDLSKASHLFFVVSPIWYGMDDDLLAPVSSICQNRNVSFLDFSNSSKYVHNNFYFSDGAHLNAIGADEFSRDLIKELRKEFADNYQLSKSEHESHE